MASVAAICPDTNIELSVDAPQTTAIRGGKSAIVKLAASWARAGHASTIFSGRVRASDSDGTSVRPVDECAGDFDVAVYVTGSLGHFREVELRDLHARRHLFWINGPHRVEPPQAVDLDWYVAPAKFMARRAIDEWDLPPVASSSSPGTPWSSAGKVR